MMKNIRLLVGISFVLFLTACGGSSSSGGGGGSNSLAGVYVGGGPATFRVGSNTVTDQTAARVVINTDGTVQASDGSGDFQTNGRLNGNRFQTSGPARFDVGSGVVCNLNLNYSGQVNGDRITGSYAGRGTCSGIGAASVNGTYTANKTQSFSRASSGSSIRNSLSNLSY